MSTRAVLAGPGSDPGAGAPRTPVREVDMARSAEADARMARTVADFGRLLAGAFRRVDPRDADRPALVRATRLAVARLGLSPAEVVPGEGETVEQFVERFARCSGARARPVMLGGDRLDGDGPIVALRTEGGPVVLVSGWFSGPVPIDPLTGATLPACGQLQPTAWAFSKVLPAGKLGYRAVVGLGLRPCLPHLAGTALCGLAASVLAMLTPVAFSFVTSSVIPTDDAALLWQIAAALFIVLALQSIVDWTGELARSQAEGRASIALHAAMVDRVLRLRPASVRGSSTAILATQMETVGRFRGALLAQATSFVLAAIHGVTAAVLVCLIAPSGGLVAVATVLLLLLVSGGTAVLQFRAIYEGERMDVVVLTFVYDLIRLVPVLQAHRSERAAFVRWAENFMAFQSRLVRSARFGNALPVLDAVWGLLTLACCFAAIAAGGLNTAPALGAAIAFTLSLRKLNAAGTEMSHAIVGTGKLMPMAKLARSLIEQTVDPLAAGRPVHDIDGALQVAGMSFGYGAGLTLQELNVAIAAGEFVGIGGPSGAGKSTLLRLLIGIEIPDRGVVMIDGMDLRSLDRDTLARRIGLVAQNGQLWSGSIYDNIRGVTELSPEEAHALADRVGLGPDLADMPMGLQTIVGEGGAGLSRWQVQRILVARALAGRPRILVLDEPGGTLDPAERDRLIAVLRDLDITRVVVSHDPLLLAAASRRLWLDGDGLTEIAAFAPGSQP